MAKDNFSSQLQGIPFDNIIGAPLNAVVEAQKKAAQASLDFIRSAELHAGSITEENRSAVISFKSKDDHQIHIKAPLLTIVPIPYIAVNDVDLTFKTDVNSTATNDFNKK